MRYSLLLISFFLFAFNSNAQFFSGKYSSLPSFYTYDEIKIAHDNQGGNGLYSVWGGKLAIKGIINGKVEFEVEAEPVKEEDANPYIREILGVDIVKTVYGFAIEEDNGEIVSYTLMGYPDGDNYGRFIVVEQVYKNENDENPELNVFFWKVIQE